MYKRQGLNEAFILDGNKKRELISEDPKSAEIIRPILRGRDIKRYEYTFADLWLITTFPSKKYDIDNFPGVKKHLLSFGIHRLEQTGGIPVSYTHLDVYKRQLLIPLCVTISHKSAKFTS